MNTSKFSIHAEDGIRFFGETTASVSHEIKNCLAIMNESAGLLQDLVMLSRKGKPLDPERIDRIAGQISGQIKRADAIVKNMNSFAHSTDVPEKSTDMGEILSLAMTLAQRSAANQGVSIRFAPPQEKIIAVTHPFFLMYAIRRCLDFSIKTIGPEKVVEVMMQAGEGNIEIVFRRIENPDDQNLKISFCEKLESMLEKLGGHLLFHDLPKGISLVLNRTHQK
ncbi:MAG: sensor histidine kinase [Desulfobacteraceae bacterium]|nr:MAG: sensor histidine kinase [Desulfobacteraceae bacterium]